jgi:hypothetical protein
MSETDVPLIALENGNANDSQWWLRNQLSQDNEYKFLMLFLYYVMIVTLTVILAVEMENCICPFDKVMIMTLIEALLVFSALLSIPWSSELSSNRSVKELLNTIYGKITELSKVNATLVIIILFMILAIRRNDGKVPDSCSIPTEDVFLTAYIVVMCVNCAAVPLYLKYAIDDKFLRSAASSQ